MHLHRSQRSCIVSVSAPGRARHHDRSPIMFARLVQPLLAVALVVAASHPPRAPDMMRHLALASPAMTQAEMSRADVEAKIAAAGAGRADFSGRRLSGL